jgi:hypothetical protein
VETAPLRRLGEGKNVGQGRGRGGLCSPQYKTPIKIDASEENDGSFRGFWPETFAMDARSEAKQ